MVGTNILSLIKMPCSSLLIILKHDKESSIGSFQIFKILPYDGPAKRDTVAPALSGITSASIFDHLTCQY